MSLFPEVEEVQEEKVSPETTLFPEVAPGAIGQDWLGPLPSRPIDEIENGQAYLDLLGRNRAGRMTFLEGISEWGKEDIPFYGHFASASQINDVVKTIRKLKAGEDVTDEEVVNLNFFVQMNKRLSDAEISGKVGTGVRNLVTFAGEILTMAALFFSPGPDEVGAGAATVGGRAAKKVAINKARHAIGKYTTSFLKKSLIKNATGFGKVANAAADIGVRGLIYTAANPGLAAQGMANQRLRQIINTGDVDEKQAVMLGFVDAFTEHASEASGLHLGRVAGAMMPARMRNLLMGHSVHRTVSKTKELGKVGDFFGWVQQAGANGIVEEMAEERLGGFMRGLAGVEGDAGLINAIDKMIPEWEDAKVEFFTFAVPSGVVMAGSRLGRVQGLGGVGLEDARTNAELVEEGTKNPGIVVESIEKGKDSSLVKAVADNGEASLKGKEGMGVLGWLQQTLFGRQFGSIQDMLGLKRQKDLVGLYMTVKQRNIDAEKTEAEASDLAREAVVKGLNEYREVQSFGVDTEAHADAFRRLEKDGKIEKIEHPNGAIEWVLPQNLTNLDDADVDMLVSSGAIRHYVKVGDAPRLYLATHLGLDLRSLPEFDDASMQVEDEQGRTGQQRVAEIIAPSLLVDRTDPKFMDLVKEKYNALRRHVQASEAERDIATAVGDPVLTEMYSGESFVVVSEQKREDGGRDLTLRNREREVTVSETTVEKLVREPILFNDTLLYGTMEEWEANAPAYVPNTKTDRPLKDGVTYVRHLNAYVDGNTGHYHISLAGNAAGWTEDLYESSRRLRNSIFGQDPMGLTSVEQERIDRLIDQATDAKEIEEGKFIKSRATKRRIRKLDTLLTGLRSDDPRFKFEINSKIMNFNILGKELQADEWYSMLREFSLPEGEELRGRMGNDLFLSMGKAAALQLTEKPIPTGVGSAEPTPQGVVPEGPSEPAQTAVEAVQGSEVLEEGVDSPLDPTAPSTPSEGAELNPTSRAAELAQTEPAAPEAAVELDAGEISDERVVPETTPVEEVTEPEGFDIAAEAIRIREELRRELEEGKDSAFISPEKAEAEGYEEVEDDDPDSDLDRMVANQPIDTYSLSAVPFAAAAAEERSFVPFGREELDRMSRDQLQMLLVNTGARWPDTATDDDLRDIAESRVLFSYPDIYGRLFAPVLQFNDRDGVGAWQVTDNNPMTSLAAVLRDYTDPGQIPNDGALIKNAYLGVMEREALSNRRSSFFIRKVGDKFVEEGWDKQAPLREYSRMDHILNDRAWWEQYERANNQWQEYFFKAGIEPQDKIAGRGFDAASAFEREVLEVEESLPQMDTASEMRRSAITLLRQRADQAEGKGQQRRANRYRQIADELNLREDNEPLVIHSRFLRSIPSWIMLHENFATWMEGELSNEEFAQSLMDGEKTINRWQREFVYQYQYNKETNLTRPDENGDPVYGGTGYVQRLWRVQDGKVLPGDWRFFEAEMDRPRVEAILRRIRNNFQYLPTTTSQPARVVSLTRDLNEAIAPTAEQTMAWAVESDDESPDKPRTMMEDALLAADVEAVNVEREHDASFVSRRKVRKREDGRVMTLVVRDADGNTEVKRPLGEFVAEIVAMGPGTFTEYVRDKSGTSVRESRFSPEGVVANRAKRVWDNYYKNKIQANMPLIDVLVVVTGDQMTNFEMVNPEGKIVQHAKAGAFVEPFETRRAASNNTIRQAVKQGRITKAMGDQILAMQGDLRANAVVAANITEETESSNVGAMQVMVIHPEADYTQTEYAALFRGFINGAKVEGKDNVRIGIMTINHGPKAGKAPANQAEYRIATLVDGLASAINEPGKSSDHWISLTNPRLMSDSAPTIWQRYLESLAEPQEAAEEVVMPVEGVDVPEPVPEPPAPTVEPTTEGEVTRSSSPYDETGLDQSVKPENPPYPVSPDATFSISEVAPNALFAPGNMHWGTVGRPTPMDETRGRCDECSYLVRQQLLARGLPSAIVEFKAKSPVGDFNITHRAAVTEVAGQRYIVDQPQTELWEMRNVDPNGPWHEWDDYVSESPSATHPAFRGLVTPFAAFDTPMSALFRNEVTEDWPDGIGPLLGNVRQEGDYWTGRIGEWEVRGIIQDGNVSDLQVRQVEGEELVYAKELYEPRFIPAESSVVKSLYGSTTGATKAKRVRLKEPTTLSAEPAEPAVPSDQSVRGQILRSAVDATHSITRLEESVKTTSPVLLSGPVGLQRDFLNVSRELKRAIAMRSRRATDLQRRMGIVPDLPVYVDEILTDEKGRVTAYVVKDPATGNEVFYDPETQTRPRTRSQVREIEKRLNKKYKKLKGEEKKAKEKLDSERMMALSAQIEGTEIVVGAREELVSPENAAQRIREQAARAADAAERQGDSQPTVEQIALFTALQEEEGGIDPSIGPHSLTRSQMIRMLGDTLARRKEQGPIRVFTPVYYHETEGGRTKAEIIEEWDRQHPSMPYGDYIESGEVDIPQPGSLLEIAVDMLEETRQDENQFVSPVLDPGEEWIGRYHRYIRHQYENSDDPAVKERIREMKERFKFKEESSASQARGFETYERAAAAYGLIPKSMRFDELYMLRNNEVWRAAANKVMLTNSVLQRDVDGSPLVMPRFNQQISEMDAEEIKTAISDETIFRAASALADHMNMEYMRGGQKKRVSVDRDGDPYKQMNKLVDTYLHDFKEAANDYQTLNVEQPNFLSFVDFVVKKGNATQVMKKIVDQPYKGKILDAVQTYNSVTKEAGLALSLFHPVALLESYAALYGLTLRNPAAPWNWADAWFSLSHMQKKMQADPDFYSDWVEAGLVINVIDPNLMTGPNLESGFTGKWLANLQKKEIPALSWGASRIAQYRNWQAGWLWGKIHPTLKVYMAEHVLNEVRKDPARWGYKADFSDEQQAMQDISQLINDALGGQEFEQYMWSTPKTKQILHLLFFAPDWSLSAMKIAGTLPGLDAVFNPTASELQKKWGTQKYWPGMALFVMFALPNAIQAMLYAAGAAAGVTDEDDKPFIHQNEVNKGTGPLGVPGMGYIDITPLMKMLAIHNGGETGKRRVYLRFAKQATEIFEGWFTRPISQAKGKSSSAVRAVIEQITSKNTAGWDLDFQNEGFSGVFAGDKTGFWGSRFAYVGPRKVTPLSILSWLDGRPAAFVAPTSRGISKGSAQRKMVEILLAYADDATWEKIVDLPRRKENLAALFPELMDAVRKNGYDEWSVFNAAKRKVLSELYNDFYNALNKGKTRELERIARGILRVHGSIDGMQKSLRRRYSNAGREFPPELFEAANQAFVDAQGLSANDFDQTSI